MEDSCDFHDSKRLSDDTGGTSDHSLAESWTLLHSSDLKEDGDLSDAESVEVLANEEPPTEGTADLFSKSCRNGCFSEEEGTIPLLNYDMAPAVLQNVPAMATTSPAPKNIERANLKQRLLKYALELSILSLIIDIIFIVILASSLKGSSSFVAPKCHISDEHIPIDPLSLHMSHVLSKWNKNTEKELGPERQILKTLLAYFTEDVEMESELHHLGLKTQKHDEAVTYMGKIWGVEQENYHRMLMIGRLAHAVLDAFDLNNRKIYFPVKNIGVGNTASTKSENCSPKQGYGLPDHSSAVYQLNETAYPSDVKSSSLLKHLFLNVGSAHWNHYFRDAFHENEGSHQLTTHEQEGKEETKRSPSDLNTVDHFSKTHHSVNILEQYSSDPSYSKRSQPNVRYDDALKGKAKNAKTCTCDKYFDDLELIEQALTNIIEKHLCLQSESNHGQEEEQNVSKKPDRKEKKSSKKGNDESDTIELHQTKFENVNYGNKGSRSKKKKSEKVFMAEDFDMMSRKKPEKGRESNFKDILYDETLDFKPEKKVIKEVAPEVGKRERQCYRRKCKEAVYDWNTRMARGREKLRALNIADQKLTWLLERAKARQKSRERLPPPL